MKNEDIRKKISTILDISPKLKEILLSNEPLEEKRQKIREFMAENLAATLEETPSIPPLEWILYAGSPHRVSRNPGCRVI